MCAGGGQGCHAVQRPDPQTLSALHAPVPPQLHAPCSASSAPYLGLYPPLLPLEPSMQGCPPDPT